MTRFRQTGFFGKSAALGIALAGGLLLCGCTVYPSQQTGYGYGYGYAPAYYAPPVVVGVGYGWGGGWGRWR